MKGLSAHETAMLAMITQSGPEAIVISERRGQKDLCNSTDLPIKEFWAWEILKAAGVKNLGPSERLFNKAELPPGWKKEATSHSMWSDLLDEKGRKRAGIFFKAASYDYDAHMTATRRFSSGADQDDSSDYEGPQFPSISDGGKIVWRGPLMTKTPSEKEWDLRARVGKIAEEKLKSIVPDYEDATKNWDQEFNFGPNESERPKGQFYSLYVSLSKNGQFCDSGQNSVKLFLDDATAIREFTRSIKNGTLASYDVNFTIHSSPEKDDLYHNKGQKVHTGTYRVPHKPDYYPCDDKYYSMGYDDFGRTSIGTRSKSKI